MVKATKEFLAEKDALWETRKKEILETRDELKITGTAYYVSNDGDDNNDGKSVDTAWKTLNKVTNAPVVEGDGVFFKRGDLFRGTFTAMPGVAYGAYGEGEKPKFYSGDKNLADKDLWELYDKDRNIWKLNEKILDAGTLVFNDGEAHSRKLIPNFIDGKFYLRDDNSKEFNMAVEMTCDLDLFCDYREVKEGNKAPLINDQSFGDLYLRCDKGNPGEIYSSIEPLLRFNLISVRSHKGVTLDNLCIKYVGAHGIGGGGFVSDLTVTNCEFGFIGGGIQFYDSNQNGRVVRFGNAIEIYGGCENYIAANNYIYEVYDAGITHQYRVTSKNRMENIVYKDNLIEKCVYGIEYFLDQLEGESESRIRDCVMKDNFIRLSGYGWGQQRPDVDTPAAIKSWNHTNMSENFLIKDNIFDRGDYHFLHLCAITDEHCPVLDGNTYIQNLGKPLGKFGGYEKADPPIHTFDMQAEEKINNIFGDKNAKVYYID